MSARLTGYTRRAACLLLMAAAAVGCDAVGQPLVDRAPLGQGQKVGDLCEDPPKCELKAALPIAKFEALSATEVNLGRCGPADPCAAAAYDHCQTWTVGGPNAASELHMLPSCTELHIMTGSEPVTRLAALEFDHVNVRIEAQTPVVVELSKATLRSSFFSLAGPVTLRIVDSTTLISVHIASRPGDGSPRVELDHVKGTSLIVGEDTGAFDGAVSIERSALTKSQLNALSVNMESVSWVEGLVRADDVVLTDVKLDVAEMRFETGLFSASKLRALQVDECGSLALIDCNTSLSHIPGCKHDALRVYSGQVSDGLFGGKIESDTAAWTGVLFGITEPTDLLIWGGSMTSTQLCEQTQSLRMGASVAVSCSDCRDKALTGKAAACMLAQDSAKLEMNMCHALMMTGQPLCSAPLPIRERP